MGGEDVGKGRAQGQGAKAEGTRLTGNIHARGAACWMLAVTHQSWGWSAVPGTNRGRKARVPRHLMQDNGGCLQSLQERGQPAWAKEGGEGAFPRLPGVEGARLLH